MRTKEILNLIEGSGGFNNWRRWNLAEVTEWVLANYDCSRYVAKNVAWEIK